MENQELWQKYNRTRDRAIREKLLMIYLPLVKLVANRVKQTLPQTVQTADLEGSGVRGLIQSVEGFDPERGIKFESYASSRIRGSILDGLREFDWLPRSIRAKSKLLERAMDACEVRLGRLPTDDEVAQEMNLALEDYYDLLEKVGSVQLVSLDGEPSGVEGVGSFYEVIPDVDAQDPLETIEHEEERSLVVEWLQELPEQMRRVMVLYYYEELTLKEIGEVLGLSESRICQIHSASIHSLRARLQPEKVA
jgi:RNA polymerase sigma factor for flagellar operon FliA